MSSPTKPRRHPGRNWATKYPITICTSSNLSTCTTPYDTCATSVLDAALNDIATIAAEMSTPLKLSVALMAGQYTPTSVMSSNGVDSLDFPQKEGGNTSCTRQPLAWHTTTVNPYVPTTFESDYTAAVLALGAEIRRILLTRHVKINIIKESGLASNSIEFDVAARNTLPNLYTYTDPQTSSPPQSGAALLCPDHYPTQAETAATALITAYAATGTPYKMNYAFEYSFGYIMGFEEGLASQPGPATGALLSVPTKGQQAFAQVDCGQPPMETVCIADPSAVADLYNWEDYYFFQFLQDSNNANSHANVAAAAGYAAACGSNCAAFPGTIAPSEMSVVNTGLDVSTRDLTGSPIAYATEPQCWINALPSGPPYLLQVYDINNDMKYHTLELAGTGVVLGWQTQTESGKYCSNSSGYDLLDNGIKNGGQYFEIETDAAAETECEPQLSNVLSTLLTGNGNTTYTCSTSP